jgi:hypothetical protein
MMNKDNKFLRECEATDFEILILKGRRAHTQEGGCWAAVPPSHTSATKIKKIASFVDTLIANVLRDLPFSLKLATKIS